MTSIERYAAAAERNRMLGRLRRWTVACVIAAAGLVGFISIVAVSSFPGNTGTGTPNGATNSTPAPPAAQDGNGSGNQPQQPAGGVFGSGRGSASAVSGGS